MILKKTSHDHHLIAVRINVDSGDHYASLYCQKCKTQIQWLSKADAEELIRLAVPVERIYTRKVKSRFKS